LQIRQGLQGSFSWQHLLQLSCPVLRLLLPATAFIATTGVCFVVSTPAVYQEQRFRGLRLPTPVAICMV
jgi:hypothetical protein